MFTVRAPAGSEIPVKETLPVFPAVAGQNQFAAAEGVRQTEHAEIEYRPTTSNNDNPIGQKRSGIERRVPLP